MKKNVIFLNNLFEFLLEELGHAWTPVGHGTIPKL
jgi:hypothetical protein